MSWIEWSSVLRLSIMWQMDEMQQVAVERISSLPVSTEEWIYVLKLSTQWHISKIRNKAIERLNPHLQPVDRVLLARDCQVSEWLSRGYRAIVDRAETISESDEEKLGTRAAMKLFRLRDAKRVHHDNGWGINFHEAIHSAFKVELEKAEYLHDQTSL
jgi:hypothetical protein